MEQNKQQYFPLEKYMEIGMGVLKISPNDLWDMTLYEFMCAYKGYLKSIGYEKISPEITKEEIEQMQEIFPDS